MSFDAAKLVADSIRESIPEEVVKHANAARADVYFGPRGIDAWRDQDGDDSQPDYSFEESLQTAKKWMEDNIENEYWISRQTEEVVTTDPFRHIANEEEAMDAEIMEWHVVKKLDVMRELLDKEVVACF